MFLVIYGPSFCFQMRANPDRHIAKKEKENEAIMREAGIWKLVGGFVSDV